MQVGQTVRRGKPHYRLDLLCSSHYHVLLSLWLFLGWVWLVVRLGLVLALFQNVQVVLPPE
jgi:hypothetical protein